MRLTAAFPQPGVASETPRFDGEARGGLSLPRNNKLIFLNCRWVFGFLRKYILGLFFGFFGLFSQLLISPCLDLFLCVSVCMRVTVPYRRLELM